MMVFQFLRKKIDRTKAYSRSPKGQVAIILLLVTAFALIFYAVSMNLGSISQTKTIATIASNQGASLLASEMASKGNVIFREQMGGEAKKCAFTGIFAALVAFIVIVLSIITFQPEGIFLALAIIGAAMTALAVGLQAAFVQPGISSMWNKITWSTLSEPGAFIEQGIRQGLTSAVTDNVQVPDVYDVDTDQVFGFNADGTPKDVVSRFGIYYGERLKQISALNIPEIQEFIDWLREFLYLNGNPPEPTENSGIVKDAGNLSSSTHWGLHDPLDIFNENNYCFYSDGNPNVPSECNPCCLPMNMINDDGLLEQFRPECCDNGQPKCTPGNTTNCECGTASTCYNLGPYTAPGWAHMYPYVFNQIFFQNFENNDNPDPAVPPSPRFLSFLEQLGHDDESREFYKNPLSINDPYANQFYPMPGPLGNQFYLNDTTSFYTSPAYLAPPLPALDLKQGIFPLFYKIADWGVDLNANVFNDPLNPECQWCDPRDPVCQACDPVYHPIASEARQLNLPVDPVVAALQINTTYQVDGTNDNLTGFAETYPPLASDKIVVPSAPAILAGDDVCAQDMIHNPVTEGFWKRGGDRYCSPPEIIGDAQTTFPYNEGCAKHIKSPQCTEQIVPWEPPVDIDCSCDDFPVGDPNRALWVDDPLDDLVYGIPDFIEWAENFINRDLTDLLRNFEDWYPEVADWIEPAFEDIPPECQGNCVPGCVQCCYLCQSETDGAYLSYWRKEIREIKNRLISFRDQNFSGDPAYVDGACKEVWCVPPGPNSDCPEVPPAEYASFDANANGVQGDMYDIIQCLNWNVDDVKAGVAGNYDKFLNCRQTCSAAACSTPLPRTLLPDNAFNDDFGFGLGVGPYDPQAFLSSMEYWTNYIGFPCSANEADYPVMLNCLDNCSDVNCRAMPAFERCIGFNYFPSGNDPNDPTPGIGFDATVSCPGGVWAKDTDPDQWWDQIRWAIMTFITPSCNVYDGPIGAHDPRDWTHNGWIVNVGLSAQEAQNQVEKFKKRRDFLQERYTELNNVIGILDRADQEFSGFLDCQWTGTTLDGGAACKLIKARIDYDQNIPYQAIYGWQGEERTPGARDGLWHIVQVEGRIPSVCDSACDENQDPTNPDPGWPRVKTYTKSWGMRRCYEMDPASNRGVVKFRVTRVDQNVDSSLLKFPNGLPIWKFRSSPNSQFADFSGLLSPTLDGTGPCDSMAVADPPAPPFDLVGNSNIYYGAFIMNKRQEGPPIDDGPRNVECWNRAKAALAKGVSSSTCALYYLHGDDTTRPGDTAGFGFKFVPCRPF